MRLIDADVFKTEYDNLITWVSHRAEKERLIEFVNDIQKQPTVKAIPIEWLRELQVRYLKADCNMPVCVVNEILNLWEKENETN